MHTSLRMFALYAFVCAMGVALLGCESDLDKAKALAKAKQVDAAAKLFEKVLKTDKKNKEAFVGLGELYCGAGASYKGVNCLDIARRFSAVHPDDAKAKSWLKRSLFTNAYDLTTAGSLNKAEEYLLKYLKMAPNDGKAHFIGAFIKHRQGKKRVDEDDLRTAIKRLKKAIKNSKPSDTIKLNASDKTASPLQWEAHVMEGNILESLLIKAMGAFAKNKANKGKTFAPNEKDFAGAVAAYNKATALNKTQANKSKHFYPSFQVAMLYVNLKRDNKKALELLLQAEKSFPKERNVIGTIATLYKKMASEVKGRRRSARRKRKALQKKAKEYMSKYANLPKPTKKK